jgi:hypothetical protein
MIALLAGIALVVPPLAALADTDSEIEATQRRLDELKAAKAREVAPVTPPVSVAPQDAAMAERLAAEVRAREALRRRIMALEASSGGTRNPDRYPSIGLGYRFAPDLAGINTVFAAGLGEQSMNGTGTDGTIDVDLRIPLSERATFFGSISYETNQLEYPETTTSLGIRSKVSGMSFGIGVRFYFLPSDRAAYEDARRLGSNEAPPFN